MASLRLFPMAARLQAAPLRSVVRHFATGAHTAPSAPVTSRLGNTAFFTSSQPKIQFLAGALGRAGNSVPTSAASAAGRGRPAWAPTSLTSAIFRRAFSTSRRALARPQYYGHGGGQGWQPPPKPSFWQQILRRLDRIDATRLVYGMIAVNVAVFLLWQYAINSAQRFRDATLYNAMYKTFINSLQNLRSGRLWTLITSSFSDMEGVAVLFHSLGLYFIGPTVAGVVGPAGFLALYLGGGLVAALASLAAQSSLPGQRGLAGSTGASGAILSTLAFYGALFPTQQFLFFFVLPVPAWLLLGGMFSWDLYSTFSGRSSMVSSATHVGGMTAGLLAALAVRRGVWRPGPWRR